MESSLQTGIDDMDTTRTCPTSSFTKNSSSSSILSPTIDRIQLVQDELKLEEYTSNSAEHPISILYAAKAFANNGGGGSSSSKCEGHVVYKENGGTLEAHITATETASAKVISALLHSLLWHSMTIIIDENREWNKDVLIYIYGYDDDQWSMQDTWSWWEKALSNHAEKENGILVSLQENLPLFMEHLNQYAWYHRGLKEGHVALELLQLLGKRRRVPYSFSNKVMGRKDPKHDGQKVGSRGKELISLFKEVLSCKVVESLMGYVTLIQKRNWLSMNPDSVDGLPSLHLNLISGGRPLFERNKDSSGHGDSGSGSGSGSGSSDGVGSVEKEESSITFEQCILEMVDMLHAPLYETLLPAVRQLTNSHTLEISDVFVRNYGRLECHENDDEDGDDGNGHEDVAPPSQQRQKTRYGLSPHYDITAYATCVMALDSTAATGQNGLYTIRRSEMGGAVSNHAALKEFFPFDKGDGVVHTFDVLHGVDVDPNLNQKRTSLIVWFTDSSEHQKGQQMTRTTTTTSPQPWLCHPTNHVEEFVLALATECANHGHEEEGIDGQDAIPIDDPIALYLSSSSQGNIFAMTQLGQLCDNGRIVDPLHLETIHKFLKEMNPSNPFLHHGQGEMTSNTLAAALWYHAGVQGGNRVAQVSLADELMLRFMSQKNPQQCQQQEQQQQQTSSQPEQEDLILMASTLFTMALFQGYDSSNSLLQLMDVQCQRLRDNGVEIPSEAFFEDSVVKTLMLSL